MENRARYDDDGALWSASGSFTFPTGWFLTGALVPVLERCPGMDLDFCSRLGETYDLDVYHAERRIFESNFRIETNLRFADCPPEIQAGLRKSRAAEWQKWRKFNAGVILETGEWN